MEPFVRTHPEISLCGLPCALCPRHYTVGESRCPGCGGTDFAAHHPTCAIVSCARRHGVVEFCTECDEYPCERFTAAIGHDSFVTYRRRDADLSRVGSHLDELLTEYRERTRLLGRLIADFDDGRHRSFYCRACALLALEALGSAVDSLAPTGDPKVDARAAQSALTDAAQAAGVDLTLRR